MHLPKDQRICLSFRQKQQLAKGYIATMIDSRLPAKSNKKVAQPPPAVVKKFSIRSAGGASALMQCRRHGKRVDPHVSAGNAQSNTGVAKGDGRLFLKHARIGSQD